jgi:mannan endo-1,4-beta-mannosidase
LCAVDDHLLISIRDGNDTHDGSVSGNCCDFYCETYGTLFYSNIQAQAYCDARVKAISTYVSPRSGITWGAWSGAILAFNIENKPFQFTDDGANDDSSKWLGGQAAHFKKYITNSEIKVATGGVRRGWSNGYNMLPAALQCSSIDSMSVHAYVGDD